MPGRSHPRCPCLQHGGAAICVADREAVRIPPQDQLARVCLTDLHRRCEIFRAFVGLRIARREPWNGEPRPARAAGGRDAAPGIKR